MLKTILNLFKLENRVVLDAAAAGHIADHHDRHQEAYHATETYSDHTAGDQKEHIGESVARAAALLSSPQASAEPTDVVLVSDSLPEYQTLVAAVRPEAIVIVYDADKDSAANIIDKITQVSEAAGKPIDSVTVLSHGDEGSFQLGTDTVTSDNAGTFGTLEHLLSDDAHIYIFGCNVSDASGKGQALLDTLATATGAKVFASDDATGNGGDWVLEASSQNAANTSAEPPIDTGKLAEYSGRLANPSIDLDANDSSGATGSDFKTSFTEGQETVGITDTDLTIKDAQNGIIKSTTITLTNPTDRSAEALVADTGNFNIKQTYNAATGVLTLEGLDTVEHYQTVLRTVQYSNTSEDPVTQERVITFTVQDSGGNTSAVATSRVAVNAVNNAPVVTLPGGGLPYGDDAGVVLLNKNAFVSDVDSRDFNGGVMTVKFTSGADTYDKISIQNGGDGGKITVSGNEVLYQGQVIATFSGGTSSVPLSFTLNDHANPVTVQSLVRSLTYENTATIPTQVNRKVEVVVTDGDGGTSTPVTQEISLNSVNDAPVNTVPGIQTILEGQSITFSKDNGTTIAIWDVDASTGTLQVNVNVIHGTLTVADGSGATVTNNNSLSVSIVGTVDQINAALNGITYQPSTTDWYGDDTLTITTDDQGNTGSGGAKRDTDTVGIKVLALNDAPIHSVPTGQTTSVDTDLVFSNVNSNRITVGDPDAGASAIQVTLSVGHGTLSLGTVADLTVSGNNTASVTITGEISKINQALDGMKYKPSSGWNGTDSMKVVTDDKGNTGQGGAKTAENTIDIAVVPKTPFNAGFTEGDSPVKIADQLTVGGVTSGLLTSAKITITNSAETDKSVESLVAVTTSQFNIKQSYNSATGVLTLEGIDTVEHYQEVLRSITYNNTSGNPNPLSRVINVQITATDGTVRDIAATTLTVKAVNNSPVLTLPGEDVDYIGTDPMIVNENAFASDVDSVNFDTGTLTVSFKSGGTATDQLSIRSEGTGTGQISISGNQVSYGGTVIGTFSGGTGGTSLVFNLNANANEVNVQALARCITYTNTIRNPVMQEREIQFVLTDGDGGTQHASDSGHQCSGLQ
ncbi:MAG: DUF4347 domain-containing protein [Desulfobacteraceae bacterium]|nr:DUF4347 domain-containing protein [Desulfobacteraceae bacterium]